LSSPFIMLSFFSRTSGLPIFYVLLSASSHIHMTLLHCHSWWTLWCILSCMIHKLNGTKSIVVPLVRHLSYVSIHLTEM
jgi:hypothetical protein